MNFKKYLMLEQRDNYNKLIVVDIQQEYQNYINFDIGEFGFYLYETLKREKPIWYMYNGYHTVGINENPESIIYWIIEKMNEYNYIDNAQLEIIYNLFKNKIKWTDKGYGFFRELMDNGYDSHDIIKLIRHMIVNRINNSIDINNIEEFGINDKSIIYMPPDINLKNIKKFDNCFICGGSRNECLKEVMLLMNSINVKYKILEKYTF